MKNGILKLVILAVASMPLLASAHPGHNHEAPESGSIHAVWILAIALSAVTAGLFFKKKKAAEEVRKITIKKH